MAIDPVDTGGAGEGSENFREFQSVVNTPHRETYDWGEIGFEFYEGWLEDVRSCAHGLRNRLAQENRRCNAADRLLHGFRSYHKIDRFKASLGADVVIEDVAPKGPLSVGQMLSLRGWFDRRRRGDA